ncbi:MAG: PEGA domain-containing protein [Planctomycetes bacterium]|nr:PEGA domain-containing protein [Planctomycetota bacterium]
MRFTVLLVPLILGGCVERLITVRSQPSGATVTVDGQRIGVTPCDVRYEFYGTRSVTLEKPGFLSISRTVELRAPWYQIFPLDFITDVLLPFAIRDSTELQFLLEEEGRESVKPEMLKERAAELRRRARE